jgi:hypothetical protein
VRSVRKTMRKYVAAAVAARIAPGGPAKSEGEWHELVREWFLELADTVLRQVICLTIAVHHDYIASSSRRGRRCRRPGSGCGKSTGWPPASRASAAMSAPTSRRRPAVSRWAG